MNIKRGYKQTEIGIIPKDWDCVSLDDVCSSITDGTHYTPKYVESGVPFYSVENVTGDDFVNVKFISQAEHIKLIKRCKPEKGDILLARIGAIGDTKLITWDLDASIYVSLALLRVNETARADYLYCYTKSAKFISELEDRSLMNASPKKMNMGDIGRVLIMLPPLSEQSAIAHALGDADALISSLEKLIAKKRQIKQGAMQKLLTGKRRLEGFNGAWKEFELSELLLKKNIKIDPKNCSCRCIELEHIEKETARIIGYVPANEQKSLKTPFSSGDILFGKLRPYLRKYANPNFDGVCSSEIWVFSSTNLSTNKYMFYTLQNEWFIEAANITSGTKMPRSEWDLLKNMMVQVPSTPEQVAISKILTEMDDELSAIRQKLEKYRQIKQGMMQELLTGRTRLV